MQAFQSVKTMLKCAWQFTQIY